MLGFPWSIPFEFPLYQWLVAILVKTFHTPIDQTGRFVSSAFFYLSLIPYYVILSHFDVKRNYRWIFLSLFVVSPLYIFWSRTFMIESTALFFSLAYLASVLCYFRHKKFKFGFLCLGVLFGVLGALVKITTFFGFALLAGLIILYHLFINRNSRADFIYLTLVSIVAFALIPYIAISTWVDFGDSQKFLNPIAADFITSKALNHWNFGSIEQRFSSSFIRLIPRTFANLFGWNKAILVLPMIVVPVFAFLGERRKLYAISIFVFLCTILTFANLHVVHNYYQYANGIFIIVATGFSILGLIEKKGNGDF